MMGLVELEVAILIIVHLFQHILTYNVWRILTKLIHNGKCIDCFNDGRNDSLIVDLFRINRDLHSWVQDHYRKQDNTDNNKPMTIFDSNSVSIPNNPDIEIVSDSSEQQHVPRKVAVLNRRTSKYVYLIETKRHRFFFLLHFRTHSATKGQLQPYKGYEPNYEDFIHAIDRKNDTLYFVSFKRVNSHLNIFFQSICFVLRIISFSQLRSLIKLNDRKCL